MKQNWSADRAAEAQEQKSTVPQLTVEMFYNANIIEFITQFIRQPLYPAQECVLRRYYGLAVPEHVY
ncbi:MAG TPA: hypothetical protein VMZ04_09645 [Anaerolineae bacterium]|nr:hypothetical protein [Anaerolineae bacterium]